jgi:transcriptional regulator with XRE-family HTH domain
MPHGSRLDNLKAQRVSAGHSIATLAKKANVSDYTITRLENGGNVDNDVAQRIADALGVSLATLGSAKL